MPNEMHQWHRHRHSDSGVDVNGGFGLRAPGTPPSPRYVESRPAGMMFSPTYPSMSSPARIWNRDIERGFSEDTDRGLLNESPKQEYDNR